MVQFNTRIKVSLLLLGAIFSTNISAQNCSAIIGIVDNTTEGCEVLTVYFEDNSSGSVSARTWDFGDGSEPSTAQNPNHSFDAGVLGDTSYVVKLTTTCGDGLTSEATQIITVFKIPQIDFSPNKNSVCAITDSICFTVDQTFDGGNSYDWDFGDGSYSSDYEPCKKYSTPGTYDIELEVTDVHGCRNSKTEAGIVTVEPVPSTAFSVSSYDGCSPFTVQFTNTTDTIGEVYTNWEWSYGDASPNHNDFGSPAHTYTTPGSYTVTLGTTNVLGCYNYSTQSITVKPTPTANMSFIETVCENDTAFIQFTGSFDSNPSFNWDFDTATYIEGSGAGPFKVKWSEAGIKNLSVTVEENGCQATHNDKIQISPLAEVYLLISQDHDSVCDGESVNFSASPGYFSNYKYFVNSTIAQNSSSNEFSSNLLTTNDEIYVEISDVNGCSRIISDTVNVTVIPTPIITLSSSAVGDTICSGTLTDFTATPAGLDNYQFLLNNIEIQNSTTNTYSLNTLVNQDRLQVIATNSGCSSVLESRVTVVKEPLPAPQVNCGNSTLSSVEFTWDALTDADSYEIRVDGGVWQSPSSGASGTSHSITGLGNDESRSIEVKAFDGSVCGEGMISQQLSCTSIACDEITFDISDPNREICQHEWLTLNIENINIPNYQIEWEEIGSENKATFNHFATADTIISVEVRNLNQATCPTVTKEFILNVIEKPDISIRHDGGNGKFCEGEVLNFTVNPPDLSDFYFYRNNEMVQHSSENSHEFETSAGSYLYNVKALKQGCTIFSDTILVQVTNSVAIPEVNYVSSDLTSVLYSWNEVDGASGYLVSENHGVFMTPSSGMTGTTHLMTGLQPGEATLLSVIALHDGPCGMSDQSQPAIGYAEECEAFEYNVTDNEWICEGDSILIKITDLEILNYKIKWANGPETTQKSRWVKASSDTTISISIRNEDQEFCPNVVRFVNIGVSEKPEALILSSSDNDNKLCEGEQVTFTALPAGYDSYIFYLGNNEIEGNYYNSYSSKEIQDGYELSVRAENLGCRGPISNSILTQVSQPLPKPQANCELTTSTSINFTWDAVSDAIGYEISIDDQHYTTPSSGISGLSHYVGGMTPGDSATISVIAISDNPCGNSIVSEVTTCYARDCDAILFDITSEQEACEGSSLTLNVSNINVPNYELFWDNGVAGSEISYDHICTEDTELSVSLADKDQPACPAITKVFNINVIETEDIDLTTNAFRDSICANHSLRVEASPPIYDRYVFYNGATIVQDSDMNKWNAEGVGNSNNIKVAVYNNGCISESESIHTEIVPVNPISLNSDASGEICSNELANFTASSGFSTYIFNDGLNILGYTGSESVELPIRSDFVTVSGYNHFNCISISDDTIRFKPLPLPSAEINSSKDEVCVGDLTTFTALPEGLSNYIFVRNGTDIMQSSTNRFYSSDSIRVEDVISIIVVDDKGCMSPAKQSPLPLVHPYPISTIGKDDSGICLYDDTRLWINKDDNYASSVSYKWSNGETSDTIIVSPEYDTKYGLIYTDALCTNAKLDEVTIGVDRDTPPVAYAGIDTVICIEDSVMLLGNGGLSLFWTPVDHIIDDPTSPNPFVKPMETTNYVLTAVNRYCTDTDTVEVFVDLCLLELEFEAPQIITPNEDGANDYWHVEHVDYFTENRLVIFNRWNNLVYEAEPYMNDWQGTNMRGDPLPEGTYFYVLELGEDFPLYKGYIIIKY